MATGEPTSFGTSWATSGTTTSSADSSGSTIATSEASDTGMPDTCAAADPDAPISAGGLALTQAWPDGGTLDAQCDAIEWLHDPTRLRLSCVHPETMLPVDVDIRMSDEVRETLDALPGTSGLRVSFYNPPRGSIGCLACFDLTIRSSDGELLALFHATMSPYPVRQGAGIDMTGAVWLEPDSAEYDEWSAPFDEIQLRDVGCAPRASLRPGSDTETPLAVELTADGATISIYDRNVEEGVEIDGQRFDVHVSDAFSRGPLNCGDCPGTEAVFAIVRSSP